MYQCNGKQWSPSSLVDTSWTSQIALVSLSQGLMGLFQSGAGNLSFITQGCPLPGVALYECVHTSTEPADPLSMAPQTPGETLVAIKTCKADATTEDKSKFLEEACEFLLTCSSVAACNNIHWWPFYIEKGCMHRVLSFYSPRTIPS